jgi:hypothetical protein
MTPNTTRVGLASSVAIAMIVAVAALSPASAQTKTWPAGTDCTKLVGNDKIDCANQSKNTNAPDNSNNPDNAATNPTLNGVAAPASGQSMPSSNSTTNFEGQDCTKLVGNAKTECANQNKKSGDQDNSNNPAQSDPAQSN